MISKNLFMLFVALYAVVDSEHLIRNKRRITQMNTMIKFMQPNCYSPLYVGYGCHCGIGGGGYPINGIDRCCQSHDGCYRSSACTSLFKKYISGYTYKREEIDSRRTITCETESGDNSTCKFQLCECDRQFAICLARFPCPIKREKCPSHQDSIFQRFGEYVVRGLMAFTLW